MAIVSPPIAVVGTGPAGLALAHALATRGQSVVVVGPDPVTRTHRPTWCAFADALPASWTDRQYASTIVRTVDGTTDLGVGYARLNIDALARDTFALANVRHVDGLASALTAHNVMVDGTVIAASLVFDARGAAPVAGGTVQSACGWWLPASSLMTFAPPPHTALMMDWSLPSSSTFAYALRDTDRVFVEETTLAADRAMPVSFFRAQLEQRLRAHGVADAAALLSAPPDETVAFAMGSTLPRVDVDVVPFGAAAGFVHPATGYSVARSLSSAQAVADAVVATQDAPHGMRVRAVVDAMWPIAARRTRTLQERGLAALLRMTPAALTSHFSLFFTTAGWRAYLDGTQGPAEASWLMLSMFARASWTHRAVLARGVFDRTPPSSLLMGGNHG
jgi:lycopene beta-cyclase